MLNFFVGYFRLADRQRRQLKAVVTLMFLLFVAMIVVEAGLQFLIGIWPNPVNGLVTVVWVSATVLILWIYGGLPLDVALGFYTGTNNKFFTAVTRVVIGFFAVEFFVGICFTVLPLYGSLAGFGLALAATPTYFLFRHMAGEPISWANWVWFPRLSIGIGLIVCVVCALKPLFS